MRRRAVRYGCRRVGLLGRPFVVSEWNLADGDEVPGAPSLSAAATFVAELDDVQLVRA
jgi:hypothetical protein